MSVLTWVKNLFTKKPAPTYTPTPIQQTISRPPTLPYTTTTSRSTSTTRTTTQPRPSIDFVGPMPQQPTRTDIPVSRQTFFGAGQQTRADIERQNITDTFMRDQPKPSTTPSIKYTPPSLTQSTSTTMTPAIPIVSSSQDWFRKDQEKRAKESMAAITEDFMRTEKIRTENVNLEKEVKNLQLSIIEYNKNVENYQRKPAVGRSDSDLKKLELQKEAILSDLDTRINVLKTEGGTMREVPATFETVKTISLLSPAGLDTEIIKIKFIPSVKETKRFGKIKEKKPSLWYDAGSGASKAQDVKDITKTALADINMEYTDDNRVLVEPEKTKLLAGIDITLGNNAEKFVEDKALYETEFKTFLAKYPDSYADPQTGQVTIVADEATFDQAGWDKLQVKFDELGKKGLDLEKSISDRTELERELEWKHYRVTTFLEAEQKKLKGIRQEDKLKVWDDYYMEKYKDKNPVLSWVKTLPLGFAKGARGVVKATVVDPARVVIEDIKDPLPLGKRAMSYGLMNPFQRGIYDPFRQDPDVPWYKETDWGNVMGAVDTALIGGSFVRGAMAQPLKTQALKAAGKSTIAKKILMGLGIVVVAAPPIWEGGKAVMGKQTWGQAGVRSGISHGRLAFTVAGTAAAGKVGLEAIGRPRVEKQITEGIHKAISDKQLLIDSQGRFKGALLKKPAKGADVQGLKDTSQTLRIYTKDYGGIEVLIEGKHLRSTASNLMSGMSISNFKYRWVDAKGTPTSQWNYAGKIVGKEFGVTQQIPGKYTTPKEMAIFQAQVKKALASGKPLPRGIRSSDLISLRTGNWNLVKGGFGKSTKHYLVLGKSREAVTVIKPTTTGKIKEVILQQGVSDVTRKIPLNIKQYNAILKNQMSYDSVLKVLRTKDTTGFINTYGQTGPSIMRLRTGQEVLIHDLGAKRGFKDAFTGTSTMRSYGKGGKDFVVKIGSGEKPIHYDVATKSFLIKGQTTPTSARSPYFKLPGKYVVTDKGLVYQLNTAKIPSKLYSKLSNLFKTKTKTGRPSTSTTTRKVVWIQDGKQFTITKPPKGDMTFQVTDITAPVTTKIPGTVPKPTVPGVTPKAPTKTSSAGVPIGLKKSGVPARWTAGPGQRSGGDVMTRIGGVTIPSPKPAVSGLVPSKSVIGTTVPSSNTLLSALAVTPQVISGGMPSGLGFAMAGVPTFSGSYAPPKVSSFSGTETITGLEPLVKVAGVELQGPSGMVEPVAEVVTEEIVDEEVDVVPEVITDTTDGTDTGGTPDTGGGTDPGTDVIVPTLPLPVYNVPPGLTPGTVPLAGLSTMLPGLWAPAWFGFGSGRKKGLGMSMKSIGQVSPVADWRIFFQKRFGFLGDPKATRKIDIYTGGTSKYDVGGLSNKIMGMLK